MLIQDIGKGGTDGCFDYFVFFLLTGPKARDLDSMVCYQT